MEEIKWITCITLEDLQEVGKQNEDRVEKILFLTVHGYS